MAEKVKIMVDGVTVDLKAITSIAHRCDPALCRDKECCCTKYEVQVTEREITAIVGAMPRASKHSARLKRGGCYDNVFGEADDSSYCIDTDHSGRCVFLYKDADGSPLCSLHTAALEMGFPPGKVKPRSCALWPLALSEGRPRELSIQDDALEFPCNRKRRARGLDPEVESIIASAFGTAFLEKVKEEIRKTRS